MPLDPLDDRPALLLLAAVCNQAQKDAQRDAQARAWLDPLRATRPRWMRLIEHDRRVTFQNRPRPGRKDAP